jgi:hypothetical protein
MGAAGVRLGAERLFAFSREKPSLADSDVGVSTLDSRVHPPASHTTAINRSAEVGFLNEEITSRLTDLWTDNRAQTYYQTGKETRERATAMLELATDIHSQILSLAGVTHECVCA